MLRVDLSKVRPHARVGELVRSLRLRRGMSQFDLADVVGIDNSYLSRIESGERRPSPKILKKFAEVLHYSYDDLIVTSGILSAEFVRASGSALEDPVDELRRMIEKIQGRDADPAFADGHIGNGALRELPIYDTVPAGLMKESNVVETYAGVEKLVLTADELGRDPRAFALIVRGDSMVDAGILDGDIVVVSPATPVGVGDIAVVRFDGLTTAVKKVFIEGDRIILQSANSQYKPIVRAYPDEAEILGKVVLVRRRMF
jgi:SOS-response transcriptional repressor LexA